MFSIEKFLIQNKIEYRASGKNVSIGEYSICCPYCSEGRYHCGINPNKGLFNCWICSSSGSLIKLLSKLLNISYTEAKDLINPQNDLKKVLDERNNKILQKTEISLKNKTLKLPLHCKSFIKDSINIWQQAAYRFLQEKYNLSWDEILEADLHYCYWGNKYKNCIIIPIYKDRKLVNYIARTWDKNSKKRYMNCSNQESLVNIKKLCYNLDNIKIGQNLLIIVEGAFDAIKVGLDRSIATLGSEISQEQINLIVGLKPKKIIILADNDPGNPSTLKKAHKLADYISPFILTKVIEIPFKGKDPADLTKEQINNLIGE